MIVLFIGEIWLRKYWSQNKYKYVRNIYIKCMCNYNLIYLLCFFYWIFFYIISLGNNSIIYFLIYIYRLGFCQKYILGYYNLETPQKNSIEIIKNWK